MANLSKVGSCKRYLTCLLMSGCYVLAAHTHSDAFSIPHQRDDNENVFLCCDPIKGP